MAADYDIKYMQRALQLARMAEGNARPNPMVGAVVVSPDGRIAGEGYHRLCGEGHAEVNALAQIPESVALSAYTIYVTLEPCAHYGKTPPCSRLILARGIGHVVVGTVDPFSKVGGRGIQMLREGGVRVDILDPESDTARECFDLNRRFFTAHTLQRPYITLKWAQSADGYIDSRDNRPFRFSSDLSGLMVHRLRSLHDAILVGSGTMLADHPRLTVRSWPQSAARQPLRVVLDRSRRVADPDDSGWLIERDYDGLPDMLHQLYHRGITSLLVEGGATVLQSFVASGLWDEARVEVSAVRLGERGSARAPQICRLPDKVCVIDSRRIFTFRNR